MPVGSMEDDQSSLSIAGATSDGAGMTEWQP